MCVSDARASPQSANPFISKRTRRNECVAGSRRPTGAVCPILKLNVVTLNALPERYKAEVLPRKRGPILDSFLRRKARLCAMTSSGITVSPFRIYPDKRIKTAKAAAVYRELRLRYRWRWAATTTLIDTSHILIASVLITLEQVYRTVLWVLCRFKPFRG